MVGLALLGGAILVAFGLFPTAYSSLIQSRDTEAATHLALQVLDGARSVPFLQLPSLLQSLPSQQSQGGGGFYMGPPPSGATNVSVNVTHQVNGAPVVTQFFYDLNLTMSQPTAYLYYDASVVVRWDSGSVPGSGTHHQIQMDTVIQNK
jgi:hypothetical protein